MIRLEPCGLAVLDAGANRACGLDAGLRSVLGAGAEATMADGPAEFVAERVGR